ncbi:hypothetical protein M409DRAFT_54711 [Zasmidium cellare ATCC 36951]|uniref:Uncharacterized protein n=1 Tax=Zasmidium cellare ATCC 36951 TaxID=1080233 RepID=A0A6A6CLC3_ZASCE|nr:uncharacterized protein M409DRAFT_54711 [Zasmidium cellare ATCC 36951]KAF2166950.1 hypothetical protein M409DRAFT_54711 [Zasmidium cellare ATCC 36951]
MARGIPLCCGVIAFLLLQTYANFTPDCRYLANGQVQDGVGSFAGTSAHRLVYCDDQASSATTACCAYGELCTADSICYNASSSGTDRWYVAGCNDPDYEASVCRKSCGSNSLTYIQWDSSTDLWQFCGDGGCSGGVTNETFSAPPPTEVQHLRTMLRHRQRLLQTQRQPLRKRQRPPHKIRRQGQNPPQASQRARRRGLRSVW